MSDQSHLNSSTIGRRIQIAGTSLGPLAALACILLLPDSYASTPGPTTPFSAAGRATLAIMSWMAIWWLTEAVSVYVTALLPLALFPLLGAGSISDAAFPYANPIIYLFMGGFLMSLAMERWGLGKRTALLVLRTVGSKPRRIVAGFMLTTATFSAFVSNTATTAMMLPIAISVIGLVATRPDGGRQIDRFATCLMLAIAYAASIGGVATIIGTQPNVFLVGFLREGIAEEYRVDIGFGQWLLIGLPTALVFLPIAYGLLTCVLYPIDNSDIPRMRDLINDALRGLGSAKRGEIATFVVFIIMVTLWIFRPLLTGLSLGDWRPLAGLTDTGIAMSCALVLFLIPVRDGDERTTVLDWRTAERLPWGILILFGGGLSLADAVERNGVAEFIASFTTQLGHLPPLAIVVAVTAAVIFLTELTSNTATAATLVPILAALGPGLGVHPYLLIFPATLAASFAFMLPVATPPNAIVFGSGRITLGQMARSGIWLNLAGIVIITLMAQFIVGSWFVD